MKTKKELKELQDSCADYIPPNSDGKNKAERLMTKPNETQGQGGQYPLLSVSQQRELLIAFAKWMTTMDEMYIEDTDEYVDCFIKESNL